MELRNFGRPDSRGGGLQCRSVLNFYLVLIRIVGWTTVSIWTLAFGADVCFFFFWYFTCLLAGVLMMDGLT